MDPIFGFRNRTRDTLGRGYWGVDYGPTRDGGRRTRSVSSGGDYGEGVLEPWTREGNEFTVEIFPEERGGWDKF